MIELLKVNCLDDYGDRKSFYGKCAAIVSNEETDKNTYLLSYDTIVCYVDEAGKVHRTWSGYSATTMRHINAFLRYCGINEGGKAFWDALPVEALPSKVFVRQLL